MCIRDSVRAAGSEYENDYQKTVNFMHSTWQNCNGTKGYNRKRGASSAYKGQPDNGGGNDTKRRRHNPNFKPEAKSYPKEEWFKLSKDQRDAVIKLRKEARQQRKNQADSDSQRLVAAAMANSQDKQVQMAKAVTFEPDPRQDQAGNQFGRHAHQQ